MRIKFMIHRSKNSFLRQKEIFRKIVEFYKPTFPGLKFVDKGVRFSIMRGAGAIDFDFGYYHMEKRGFKAYDYVISTGLFAVFNPRMLPGDLILPSETTHIQISPARTKVTIDTHALKFDNKMGAVLRKVAAYESGIDTALLQRFIYSAFKDLNKYKIRRVNKMRVFSRGRIITCNTIFLPSELEKADVRLKGKKNVKIDDLKSYLEKNTDGLNCETKGMIERAGRKMLMLSWGLDKPYRGAEFSVALRHEKNYRKIIPTFNLAQKTYFYFLLLGYLIKNKFRY